MSAPGTTPDDLCADAGPNSPRSPGPVADQLSGDLLCPLCEEPLEITGLSEGFCARCMANVEIC